MYEVPEEEAPQEEAYEEEWPADEEWSQQATNQWWENWGYSSWTPYGRANTYRPRGRSSGASASTATGAAAFAGQWYQTYQYDPASENAVSKTTLAGSASLIASQFHSARGDSVCAVNVATVSETSFIDSAPFMMMILIVACVLVGVIVLCLAKSRFERQLADKVSKMQQTANQEKERMEQMEQHQERLEAALAAAEAAVAASTRTQTRAGEPKSKARARAQSAPVPTRTMAVQSQCTYSSVRSNRERQISQPRFEFLSRGEDGAFVM